MLLRKEILVSLLSLCVMVLPIGFSTSSLFANDTPTAYTELFAGGTHHDVGDRHNHDGGRHDGGGHHDGDHHGRDGGDHHGGHGGGGGGHGGGGHGHH